MIVRTTDDENGEENNHPAVGQRSEGEKIIERCVSYLLEKKILEREEDATYLWLYCQCHKYKLTCHKQNTAAYFKTWEIVIQRIKDELENTPSTEQQLQDPTQSNKNDEEEG